MPEGKHPLFQNKRLSLPPVNGMNLRRLTPNVCPTCPHLIMETNVKVTWGAVSENGRGAWISTFAASICSHRSQTPVCKACVRFQVTMMICKNENNVGLNQLSPGTKWQMSLLLQARQCERRCNWQMRKRLRRGPSLSGSLFLKKWILQIKPILTL